MVKNENCFAVMKQYKIYVGEKPFFITDKLNNELDQLASTDGAVLLHQPGSALLKKAFDDLELTTAKAVIVLTNNVDEKFAKVQSLFAFIRAAGGLVKNTLGEYLFIFRHGKWDLPKGKLDDDGETLEQCALREVKEETGLRNVKLQNFMLHTWHVYRAFDQHVLKQTSWFKMASQSGQSLMPQIEEDIEEVIWLDKENWPQILQNTFLSIKDVLNVETDGSIR